MTARRMSLVAALGAFALAAGGASSCETATKDAADSDSKSGSGKKTKPHQARLGDSITVSGQDDAKLKVTLQRVRNPVKGGEFDQPESGNHYVGVMVRVKNLGKKTYTDSLSNGAQLITTSDEQIDTTIVMGGPCGGDFAHDLKLAPGDSRAGCIAFEAPKNATLRKFQLTLDSGFGGEAAEWRLR